MDILELKYGGKTYTTRNQINKLLNQLKFYWLIPKKDFLLIDYNDLVRQPEITFNKIYNYYGIDLFNHSFKNFKKKLEYDDSIFGALIHKIRTDEIKKDNNDIKLSKNVISKYKHLNNIIFK